MTSLSDSSLAALAEQVASSDPAPGAGPSAAWTCALAAALVEMVSAVALRKDADDPAAAASRRDRAAALRARALELADEDVRAYSAVLAVLRRRDGAGARRAPARGALRGRGPAAARSSQLAAEVTRLAADAAAAARGGVRGEAMTAAILAEAVARAGLPLVDLNLASAPEDPRRARVRELAEAARGDLGRAIGD